jgi:LuxR family quorum sensing-dependent transcriptional regulator
MNGHEALFDRLAAVTTEIELAGFLRALTSEFGLTRFSILGIPATDSERLSKQIKLSDLPPGFIESYDSLGLLRNSPIFAALKRSTAPIAWSLDSLNDERPADEVDPARKLFSEHKMTMGVYYPVHGPNGRRAAMGFFGDRLALTYTEMGELGIFVLHAYDAYSNLKNKTKTEANGITARELEVLHWAANGKTSTEIAAILSLSDHTVNTYMNSAMRKLDCVNRTQLVAKALRLHLIS